jgi:hypothetical protein
MRIASPALGAGFTIMPIDPTCLNCNEITRLIQPDRVGPVDPRQLPIADLNTRKAIGLTNAQIPKGQAIGQSELGFPSFKSVDDVAAVIARSQYHNVIAAIQVERVTARPTVKPFVRAGTVDFIIA